VPWRGSRRAPTTRRRRAGRRRGERLREHLDAADVVHLAERPGGGAPAIRGRVLDEPAQERRVARVLGRGEAGDRGERDLHRAVLHELAQHLPRVAVVVAAQRGTERADHLVAGRAAIGLRLLDQRTDRRRIGDVRQRVRDRAVQLGRALAQHREQWLGGIGAADLAERVDRRAAQARGVARAGERGELAAGGGDLEVAEVLGREHADLEILVREVLDQHVAGARVVADQRAQALHRGEPDRRVLAAERAQHRHQRL
jgi:hypothetical protein